MNYVALALAALLAVVGLKACNGWKHDAQVRGIADAEKQIAESIAESNKDAEREMRVLLAKRDDRFKAQAKVVAQRKVADVKQKTVDPVYRAWADERVPQYVVDQLRANAAAPGGVRGSAGDEQSGSAVQTSSAGTTSNDGKRRFEGLRLGPARPTP